MARKSRENPEVREFILRNLEDHPGSITSIAATRFGLSRTAINGYMQRLLNEELIDAEGIKRGRKYTLRPLSSQRFEIPLSKGLSEDNIWRFRILPNIGEVKKNIVDICQYGFTEIFNNAIDHSASEDCSVLFSRDYCKIKILVIDRGIGIFQKIQQTFGLEDHRSALLELSKGRITSDKAKHTGEGIFFTSRMFDRFVIESGDLFYLRRRKDDLEWLIESGDLLEKQTGTQVYMTITTNADWTKSEVFEQYQTDPIRFRRTHVPIKLGNYPGEELVSRSQAKRILARFDQFSEVMLDFDGVPEIGQAFADEIFRVFGLDHPQVDLIAMNVSTNVQKMIDFVTQVDHAQGQLDLIAGTHTHDS
jgi:anti-sigma regulatory factor (Ser/Thr protein kinase)